MPRKPKPTIDTPRRRQRRTILTTALIDEMERYLIIGLHASVACRLMGLDTDLYYEWRKRGNLREGHPDYDPLYEEFYLMTEAAPAFAQARVVLAYHEGATQDPLVAGKFLKDRYKEWQERKELSIEHKLKVLDPASEALVREELERQAALGDGGADLLMLGETSETQTVDTTWREVSE
jgi:hypothetical protein